MSLLHFNTDVIILPANHITLFPVGQGDQSTINTLKRGTSRRCAAPIAALWLQPQLQLAA